MTKTKLLKDIEAIFDNTEEVLTSHFVTGNEDSYKLPALVNMVVSRLSVTDTDKAIKKADPIVRLYVKESDKWYSVQGLKGGVKPIALKEKANAAKAAKEAAKAEIKAKLAKVEPENDSE